MWYNDNLVTFWEPLRQTRQPEALKRELCKIFGQRGTLNQELRQGGQNFSNHELQESPSTECVLPVQRDSCPPSDSYLRQLHAWPTLLAQDAVSGAIPELLLPAVSRLTDGYTQLEGKRFHSYVLVCWSWSFSFFARKECYVRCWLHNNPWM